MTKQTNQTKENTNINVFREKKRVRECKKYSLVHKQCEGYYNT